MKSCTHLQALAINAVITTLAIVLVATAAFYQP